MVTTFPPSAVFYLSCGTQQKQLGIGSNGYRVLQIIFHQLPTNSLAFVERKNILHDCETVRDSGELEVQLRAE
jgi:hypothetical protein